MENSKNMSLNTNGKAKRAPKHIFLMKSHQINQVYSLGAKTIRLIRVCQTHRESCIRARKIHKVKWNYLKLIMFQIQTTVIKLFEIIKYQIIFHHNLKTTKY